MTMSTERLMLNRAYGSALPEDCVEWAVERLCEGRDTPRLRILAGLNVRFDREEVETRFQKACEELGIDVLAKNGNEIRKVAGIVRRLYEEGELSADSVLYEMARLYTASRYSDPLLGVWFNIAEERSLEAEGDYGVFYPPEALTCLDATVKREWELLERGMRLSLSENFTWFIVCNHCGHVGAPELRHRTLLEKVRALLPGYRKPAQWAACAQCGSLDYGKMADPNVRDAYFRQLEAEEAMATDC